MKKALSLILSIAISTTLAIPASAEDSTESVDSRQYALSSEAISDVSRMVSNMLDYSPEHSASEFKVGSYIPAYTWDGDRFSVDRSAIRYPVYADDKIVAFYTLIDPESGSGAKQFGVEFANELNDFVSSGVTEYFLVGFEGKVFAVSNGNADLLVDYGTTNIDLELIKARIASMEDSNIKANYEEFYKMVESKQSAGGSLRAARANATKGLTEVDLEKSLAESDIAFNVNQDQNSLSSLQNLTSSNARAARAGKYRYFKVGTYNQLPDTKICWAVATTRIGNFLTDISKTPKQVVKYIHGVDSEYGNIIDAQDALDGLYSLTTDYHDNGFTWSEVGDYIEGGTLLYGAFYDSGYTTGHAVCVNGYYIDGSEGILIMESLGGYYNQLLPDSGGTYWLNYSGLGNLSWEASLTT